MADMLISVQNLVGSTGEGPGVKALDIQRLDLARETL